MGTADVEPELGSFQAVVDYYTNYETKNWQKLLQACEAFPAELSEKRKFSWVWPNESSLQALKTLLKKKKIYKIISVGCGCGLLEWILRESIGITVFGLEIDRSWWQSRYAIRNFIQMSYIDDLKPDCKPETFLQRCCNANDWRFALVFCYFNNRKAFCNYLDMYKGNTIIIIGPDSRLGIHTDPSPQDARLTDEMNWKLCELLDLDNHGNVLAIYTKINA